MAKTTLNPIFWPLMDMEDVTPGYCAVCGRFQPTENHHPVRRGAGKLFDENGKERRKPVVQLCGFGNNLKDSEGRYYCHGLAHANMLHFRNDRGEPEFIVLDHPEKYQTALELDGWKPLRRWA